MYLKSTVQRPMYLRSTGQIVYALDRCYSTACKVIPRVPKTKKEKRLEQGILPSGSNPNQGTSATKVQINRWFCDAARNHTRRCGKRLALYIDGEDARTTSVLLNKGYKPEDLMPVCSSKKGADTISDMLGYNIKPESFSSYIKNKNLENVSAVWYDGCATFYGSVDGHKPRSDISDLLSNNNMHDTILAVTFSVRGNPSKKKPQGLDASLRHLENLVCKNRYLFTVLKSKSYQGAMYFWMVHLKKE